MAKADDDDDPFCLDFTKISLDDEPVPAPASSGPATSGEAKIAADVDPALTPSAVETTPVYEFSADFDSAPAPASSPRATPATAAPTTPPAAAVEAEASAFQSYNAPLELVDFATLSTEAVVPSPAAAEVSTPSISLAPPAAAAAATSADAVAAALPASKKTNSKKSSGPSPILLDIARQHAAGKTAEASTALEAVLRTGSLGKATEQGWGMLFDLLQILNRRQAFENLADAYAKRFERSAPAWLDATGSADCSLETGGAAYVALSGSLSAASEAALKKLVGIAESNPTVRLGLIKVTDADNDGCRLLLETLRAIKKGGRECLLTGADEFSAMLAGKVEMMQRTSEETWMLLLELYQRAGNQVAFEDTAVAYAVTFEVSPPSWETPAAAPAAPVKAAKSKDPFVLEGELLAGMSSINALASAAQGRDAITIETDNLARIDEVSAKILLDTLTPLQQQGLHIRIRGANLLVATLLSGYELDKIATLETRRR